MKMTQIRSTYHCDIELLTPVHIGSGDRYVENFDYFFDQSRKSLFVFDRNRLLHQVAEAGVETINTFTQAVEEENLDTWLKGKPEGVNMHQALVHSFPCSRKPKDIAVQLRSGAGDALIAGSSLKGAFRTSILARLSQEENRNNVEQSAKKLIKQDRPNLKFADSQICNNMLGPDAQKNLMRTLTVSDFSFDKQKIKLQNVVLSRLTGPANMGIKFGVVLEKISEKSCAGSQVSFDEFLNDHGKNTMGFRTKLSLAWLLEAVRMKTEKTIRTELNFLQGVNGNHTSDLRQFYEQLKKDCKQLDDNEVILQLAWGSGWNGMTGELLEKEDLTPRLREKLKLAPNYTDFPFPKSRRLAVGDGRAVPMGWVRLRFTDKDEVKNQQAERLKEQQRKKAAAKAKKEAQEQEKEKWDAMTEVEQNCAIIRGDEIARAQVPNKHPLADVWPRFENADSDHQKNLALAFYSAWQDYPERWRKKDCSPGQWEKVKKVVKILGIKHADIVQISAEDQELVRKIEALSDWGQYKSSGINFAKLSLNTAELLARRFRNDWGCVNRKAKKDKKQAWKELQKCLKHLRKEAGTTGN